VSNYSDYRHRLFMQVPTFFLVVILRRLDIAVSIQFLPRDPVLARHMLSSCVRLSVLPSDTSQSSTKMHKQRRTIAQTLVS